MKVSPKKVRRVTFAILFLASVYSIGIGLWWMNIRNSTALSSPSNHVHVPHPLNHMEDNRKRHNDLHSSNEKQEADSSQHKAEKQQATKDAPIIDKKASPIENKTNQKANAGKNETKNDSIIDIKTNPIEKKDIQKAKAEKTPETNGAPIMENNQEVITDKTEIGNKSNPIEKNNAQQTTKTETKETPVRESLLNCSNYGGPYDFESTEEMVYWKDIPQDLLYRSRFRTNGNVGRRFLTYDTDLAGFNNQRMVFEINLVAAVVTGRTMVIPRDRSIAHLSGKKSIGLAEFFDLEGIAKQMPQILDIMTIDEFIQSEGGPDKLNIPSNFTGFYERTRSRWTHEIVNNKTVSHVDTKGADYHDMFLLNNTKDVHCDVHKLGKAKCSNYTDWIDKRHLVASEKPKGNFYVYFLDQYLGGGHPNIFSPRWGTQKCLLTIPSHRSDNRYRSWLDSVFNNTSHMWEIRRKRFVGSPVPVNASVEDRLAQIFWQRQGLCPYAETDSQRKYWHMNDRVEDDSRLCANWYHYFMFEDWKEDLWVKRFVRDKVRYGNLLQCAAARVVAALRKLAKDNGGKFHTMHIRRTDLTNVYSEYGIDKNASEIYNEFSVKRNIIPNDSVVYIATDQKDKQFFETFKEHYKAVYFLDDFVDLLGPDFPVDYYGMLEQLICSRGEHFIGTYYSTFTSYINRLRGYHSQKKPQENETAVLEQGRIPSWYFAPPEHMDDYQIFNPIDSGLFSREFATAWRNIDYDVDPVLREKVDNLMAKKRKAQERRSIHTGDGLIRKPPEKAKKTQ